MKFFLKKVTRRRLNTRALKASPRFPSGFTVFFAILVASLALAIGLAIYDITVRGLYLTTTATQSQYAIYAADTGAECALYWDSKYNSSQSAFATSSTSTGVPASSNIFCNNQDITAPASSWTVVVASPPAKAATTTFTIQVSAQSQSITTTCATINVGKSTTPSGVSYTTIVSHGYNTCAPGARNRLERVFQINY